MSQSWRNLLFAHWPVPAVEVQRRLPAGLEADTFEGQAWVAVVPFEMRRVRPRGLPFAFDFLELNVRTYVKPGGVYFWSLDASSRLAVWGAQTFFHLPYKDARMRCVERAGWVEYESARADARFRARYRPVARDFHADSLVTWLTERYCLYTANRRGVLYRGDIRHVRWPLEVAEAEFEENSMAEACGIQLPATPPLLHYSREIEVVIWPLRKLGSA